MQVIGDDWQAPGPWHHAGDAEAHGRAGSALELPPWAAHNAPPVPAVAFCHHGTRMRRWLLLGLNKIVTVTSNNVS